MSDTISLTGVVGTDPERTEASGVPICNFRLVSSLRRFDRAKGEWIEYGANWYSIGSYRHLAENVGESIHKGDRVIVRGRLKLREWDTSSGRGWSADVDAESIGHDLRWGRSLFSRRAEARRASTQEHSARAQREATPREASAAPREGTGSAGAPAPADVSGEAQRGWEEAADAPAADWTSSPASP